MSRKQPSKSPHATEKSRYQTNKGEKETINILHHPDLTCVVEIIKSKFYFATLIPDKHKLESSANVYLFSTDSHLTYHNFFNDFGPLNISCLYKYCRGLNQTLANPAFQQVVHYTSSEPETRANAAYLVASYSLLYLKKSPSEACELLTTNSSLSLKKFQDASIGPSPYRIDLLDCLNALHKASALGFFDFDDFDAREYDKYDKFRNGDLHWIVPRKFIGFLGPSTENCAMLHQPEKYLNYFMKNDVAAVIRLNKKNYEAYRFTTANILHYDMFFPDGSVPAKKILQRFLHVAETTRGALAVHCKAGLGRTGTLIAAYLMKHYMFSAHEAIAWLRICRPGSVIGPQQLWLENMEASMWREGRRFRMKYHGDENLILHHKRGIYSIEAKLNSRKAKLQEYLNKRRALRAKSVDPYDAFNRKKENRNMEVDEDDGASGSGITQGDKLIEMRMKINDELPSRYTI